jgi:hypothetical protein
MKTIEKTVYRFSELSDDAKDNAIYDAQVNMGYSWGDDALESIKALAEVFGGKVKDYGIDFFNSTPSYMTFEMPEMTLKEIKEILNTLGTYNKKIGRGNGDCKLTGYTADEDAIDGFRASFKKGNTDLNTLMEDAYYSWIEAAQDDCEAQYQEANFSETCDANDYYFDEDGKLV